jgi:hypothetical protein
MHRASEAQLLVLVTDLQYSLRRNGTSCLGLAAKTHRMIKLNSGMPLINRFQTFVLHKPFAARHGTRPSYKRSMISLNHIFIYRPLEGSRKQSSDSGIFPEEFCFF